VNEAGVKHPGGKADQGMDADAIWQSVVDRSDLDIALQHPKTTLDVSQ
jgi:hypothetical protein